MSTARSTALEPPEPTARALSLIEQLGTFYSEFKPAKTTSFSRKTLSDEDAVVIWIGSRLTGLRTDRAGLAALSNAFHGDRRLVTTTYTLAEKCRSGELSLTTKGLRRFRDLQTMEQCLEGGAHLTDTHRKMLELLARSLGLD